MGFWGEGAGMPELSRDWRVERVKGMKKSRFEIVANLVW